MPATQAQNVIGKFGNAARLAKLLGIEVSTVCRWTYARSNGGTDGIIPGKQLRLILAVAARQTPPVLITPADLYPTA